MASARMGVTSTSICSCSYGAGAVLCRPASTCGWPAPATHRPHSNRGLGQTAGTLQRPLPGRKSLHAAQSAADDAPGGLESAFTKELAARQAAESAAKEASLAATFDGAVLLRLLQQKYGRSYDLSLVKREYMGKQFVALNVMWRYREQRSFGLTEEEYMSRLDMFARVLVAWGVAGSFTQQLTATKERPRVGKAVSIMLDVPEERVKEWLG